MPSGGSEAGGGRRRGGGHETGGCPSRPGMPALASVTHSAFTQPARSSLDEDDDGPPDWEWLRASAPVRGSGTLSSGTSSGLENVSDRVENPCVMGWRLTALTALYAAGLAGCAAQTPESRHGRRARPASGGTRARGGPARCGTRRDLASRGRSRTSQAPSRVREVPVRANGGPVAGGTTAGQVRQGVLRA